jgi:hypothetical protein
MQNDSNKFKWDVIIIASAVFNCATIPIKIAFEPESMESTSFFLINLVIDICFFIDIIVTFRTGYIDDYGQECSEPKHIAINYLQGQFWIDLVATIPMD